MNLKNNGGPNNIFLLHYTFYCIIDLDINSRYEEENTYFSDWDTDDFYTNRKEAIDDRLEEIAGMVLLYVQIQIQGRIYIYF